MLIKRNSLQIPRIRIGKREEELQFVNKTENTLRIHEAPQPYLRNLIYVILFTQHDKTK